MRRDEEAEGGRRHGRYKTSPSPKRSEDHEEIIRQKLRESGWKKRRAEDVDLSKDKDKGSPRSAEDRRVSRSPRRHEREHRSSRRKSSRRRTPSRSRSPASRSRSRSTGRRRRRHSSSAKKRRSSHSVSRSKEIRDSKLSRRLSSPSRSVSMTKAKMSQLNLEKGKKEGRKEGKSEKKNGEEVENEGDQKRKRDEENKKLRSDKKKEKEERHRPSSRKSSRRSRSGSLRSPSRSSRRRRHRRHSYSRSRSPSRNRRRGHGTSQSRSRSPRRERRSRGRDRDRRSRRKGKSYSRSRSASYSRRRRHRDRSSSRDRPRPDVNSSPNANQHPPAASDATIGSSFSTLSTGVNPTITQLMAQYPTMSLQDIIAKMQASNVTMAAAVAQKPARELYVGNLPPNVTGPQLQEFLSTIIQQVGLTTQPGNPIINTWISTDGHFAFCEMRSVEECNLALMLNQLSLLGQPLKFGRPRSFMGPPQPMPHISARTQTALANLGCTPNPAWFAQSIMTDSTADSSNLTMGGANASSIPASGSANRLIMSNIPTVLTEDQVKELVEPFGALQTFMLVKDMATGASLGSAVFEYVDENVAVQAIEGLNGLSIGGILLSVQRQPPTTLQNQPSAVLKMTNMVSIDELKDDDEYADLAEDVEEECKRFGSVAGMEIPRPKEGEEVHGLGNIYVRFEKEEEAVAALKALNGRKFGGNVVEVTYFSTEKFEKKQFS